MKKEVELMSDKNTEMNDDYLKKIMLEMFDDIKIKVDKDKDKDNYRELPCDVQITRDGL